jgi:hypothetical protein
MCKIHDKSMIIAWQLYIKNKKIKKIYKNIKFHNYVINIYSFKFKPAY